MHFPTARGGIIEGMGRKRFEGMNCGVAQALEALGDWWTLLIVRDAFFGARRFGEFERSLGIAKNILSTRLRRLVDHGVFERVAAGTVGDRYEYHLTRKGEALLPVLIALREWSDDWVFGRGHEPLILRERATGRRLPRLRVTNRDGVELKISDIQPTPGPGISAESRLRLSRKAKGDD